MSFKSVSATLAWVGLMKENISVQDHGAICQGKEYTNAGTSPCN